MVAPIRPSPLQRGRGSSPQASGERGLQGIQDARQHALFIVENVVVPESKDAEPLRAQISITASVAGTFGMMTPVSFDDEPVLQAHKIDNVMVDRHLALELERRETLCAEDLPQPMFGLGRRAAHLFRTFAQHLLPVPLPAASRLSLPRGGGRD